jgi:acyl-CoA thioester hydrolase
MITPYTPEIRFADIDAMGHVNNAVYFSYFEQARLHFFRQLVGGKWDWRKQGILVAHNEMDYMKPVFLHDHIQIHCYCTQIGSKSFTIAYEINRGEELCGKGATVLVCFDYELQKTTTVPEEWREKLSPMIGA